MEAGADVYLQKPVSKDVLEGEALVAAARKHNRVVQVGTQRKSTPHLIDAKKQIVEAGLLGKLATSSCAVTFTCEPMGVPRFNPCPLVSIMKCGQARRPYGHMMDCLTSVGGAPSWNTEMGS